MKKMFLSVLVLFAVSLVAEAGQVRPAPVRYSAPLPKLTGKKGYFAVTNQDWYDYGLSVDYNNNILTLHFQYGGDVLIPSGTVATIVLPKGIFDVRGDSGRLMKLEIGRQTTTTLILTPTGNVGHTGLQGMIHDENGRRSQMLMNSASRPSIPSGGPSHGSNRPGQNRPGPGYDRPGYDRPDYNQPGYNNRPGHNQPDYNRPGYNQPDNNRPGHNQPNNRPGNDNNRPGPNQPGFNQPGNDRPGQGRPPQQPEPPKKNWGFDLFFN